MDLDVPYATLQVHKALLQSPQQNTCPPCALTDRCPDPHQPFQAQLRNEYMSDLTELRAALLHTMDGQPEKAEKMRPKLLQVDACIALFQVGAGLQL